MSERRTFFEALLSPEWRPGVTVVTVYAYGPAFMSKREMRSQLQKMPYSVPANCIQDAGEEDKLDIYLPTKEAEQRLIEQFEKDEVEFLRHS